MRLARTLALLLCLAAFAGGCSKDEADSEQDPAEQNVVTDMDIKTPDSDDSK